MDWECCWGRDNIVMGECPNISEGEEDLLAAPRRRLLEKCVDCSNFRQDVLRFVESGHPLAQVFSILHQDYSRQKSHIQALGGFLDNKILEVRFLHELGAVLQSSVDLDEVLSVALTAITAGKGFGMNRAFLLLADKDRHFLKGYLAIGPRSPEEAGHTWEEVASSDLDLQALARSFRQNKLNMERDKFHDILEKMVISFDNIHHIVISTLEEKKPILVQDAFNNPIVDREFAGLLGVDTFLVLPLIARNRRVGVILADNIITRRPISEDDLRSIETFTFPVAFAIERASLYERLNEEVNKLQEANRRLQEQQQLLVKMEKMALVGRITSSIAHSIRNPLMIIGGFARSILKSTPADDPKRSFIDSIISETHQLEGVLDEVLTYSDSLYPTRDYWDVNQLVETTLRELQERTLAQNFTCRFHPAEGILMAYIDFKQTSYCVRNILLWIIDEQENGAIDIRTKPEGDRIFIVVEDRNRSLSEDELEAILTPFAETHEMGSGLNLALCRSMLEKNDMPFLVVAPPGEGVRYTIKLPTKKEDNQ